MNRTSLFAAVSLLLATFAQAQPFAVDVHQAIAIAEKSLSNRGLSGQVFIVSAAIQRTSLLNDKAYWFVAWDHPVQGDNKGDREVGVKIRMDGTATRLVKAPF